MARDDAAIAYAKEVYAACATVGFESDSVTRLKALLDDATGPDRDTMLYLAKQAQREAIDWAGQPDRRG